MDICPPALIYLVFSLIQIIIDIFKGLYNTAFFKTVIMIMVTLLLNALCQGGLGVVSWIIVLIPFILMTVITSMLLYIFGLNESTGTYNYTCKDGTTNCNNNNNNNNNNSLANTIPPTFIQSGDSKLYPMINNNNNNYTNNTTINSNNIPQTFLHSTDANNYPMLKYQYQQTNQYQQNNQYQQPQNTYSSFFHGISSGNVPMLMNYNAQPPPVTTNTNNTPPPPSSSSSPEYESFLSFH